MSQSSATLSIALKPSRRLRRFLIAVHGLAALAALVNGLPVWGKIAALAVVGFSTRRHLQKARHPLVNHLTVNAEQTWHLKLVSGMEVEARLLPGALVTRWLVVVHLRDATGRRHALPLLPDSVDADVYRRLCARLRGSIPPV